MLPGRADLTDAYNGVARGIKQVDIRADLLYYVENIWLQVLRAVCSHSKIELEVVRVPLKGLTHTCEAKRFIVKQRQLYLDDAI